MSGPTKLLIVDCHDARRDRMAETLRQDATLHALVFKDTFGLRGHIQDFQPDLVMVACETASHDAIADVRTFGMASDAHDGRPVVMLVDRLNGDEAEDALRAGVLAVVVEDMQLDRLRGLTQMAIAQFRLFGEMRRDLDRARTDLADRKQIERAKGLVMKRRGLDEDAAYKFMRATAMNQCRPMVEIARELLNMEVPEGCS
jgi:two-component system, response regulator / RNA-binding antiterminator